MAKRGVSTRQEKSPEPLEVQMPAEEESSEFSEDLFEGLDSTED